MTIKQWIEENVVKGLKRSELEILVCHILNCDMAELVLRENDDLITAPIQKKLDCFAGRRAAGEPLAYILGFKEFYGRNFDVDKNVLIPRPETEALVDTVLNQVRKEPDCKWQIIDVGTGSGCIAITVLLELEKSMIRSEIIALDNSEKALDIAKNNLRKLIPNSTRIDFRKSDLLTGMELKDDCSNIVVANLPYVDKNWDWLDHKSLSFEPKQALIAEEKGCELIFRLIDQIEEKIRRVGREKSGECDEIGKYDKDGHVYIS